MSDPLFTDPGGIRMFPTAGFVAGWALAGIVLSMSLEFGTRWPYIVATAALVVVLAVRLVRLRRATVRVERRYGIR